MDSRENRNAIVWWENCMAWQAPVAANFSPGRNRMPWRKGQSLPVGDYAVRRVSKCDRNLGRPLSAASGLECRLERRLAFALMGELNPGTTELGRLGQSATS